MGLASALTITNVRQRYQRYYTVIEPYVNTPQTRSYLSLALTLGCLAVFSWFAIRPTLVTIVALNKELKTLRQVNGQLEEKINALSTAQDILTQQRANFALLDDAAPIHPQVGQAIREVEGVAAISNVALTSMQYQRVGLPPVQTQIAAQLTESSLASSLSAKGSLDNLLSFLRTLGTTRRIFTTGTIGISGTKGQGVSDGQSLQLALGAAYFSVQVPTTVAKPPVTPTQTEDVLEPTRKGNAL